MGIQGNAGALLVTGLGKTADGPDEAQALLGCKVMKLLE